jgi:hypothetical protein
VKSFATAAFWARYHALPVEVRRQADQSFAQFRRDPTHPSLRFKKVGRYWSARVSDGYRALADRDGDAVVWQWIGHHDEYMRLIKAG